MGQVRGRDARRGDAGAITRLRGERTGGWLFDSAHRAHRSVTQRYRAADRRDDPRAGARDPPASLPVFPGAGRPAAAAVLRLDDRRVTHLPVFRLLGRLRTWLPRLPARPFLHDFVCWSAVL